MLATHAPLWVWPLIAITLLGQILVLPEFWPQIKQMFRRK